MIASPITTPFRRQFLEDFLANGVIDLVQGREVEVGAGQLDQADAVIRLQRADQIAEIGLVKLGNDRAQKRCVAGPDRVGNFLNEFLTNFALFIAHRNAVEYRGLGDRGCVHMLVHDAPRHLTEWVDSSELSARDTLEATSSAMTKMRRRSWTKIFAVAAATVLTGLGPARGADCPRKDALGTSRVLAVDAATYPRVGLKSFPQTLPLADHEVVLTFDDGPSPPTTSQVLAALEKECVRATFFLIGRSAAAHPDLVKRIAAQGHTIGHHTWSHPSLMRIPPGQAIAEIDRGITADEMALHGVSTTTPSTPFFRYPGFESTPATLELLQSRGIVVFGADLWAGDWNEMTPQQVLKLLTDRLDAARKGIILLHDTKARTAAMLPAFLRYLREKGYRVVHVVPAGQDTAASAR